ncbi:MAG TPA: PIG-L family deacetylase [Candidatus Binatia bacterium]|nr:PIG-L family deacetylase [Candidatus Binatia bacterium]
MNPYESFVREFAGIVAKHKNLPLGGLAMPAKPKMRPDAPKALIFAPHPDDEVIIGGLPLRLIREAGMNVINVAVTQGSSKARQAERWKELSACCDYIGFGLVATRENGLEGINLKARAQKPDEWKRSVARTAEILREHKPKVIFFPHERDWNVTHIGTHRLVIDAMRSIPDFSCTTIETEFWGAMDDPNLMVESSVRDVSDLIAALSFHAGEVRRNPYHLRMSAWLMDNVRRGGELVGGQGAAAPEFTFATLYRLRRWENGNFAPVLDKGLFIGTRDDIRTALGL